MSTPRKILVCGSRDYTNGAVIARALDDVCADLDDPVIIHGDARGVDRVAGHIARERGWWVWPCPADWNRADHAAGPIRNQRMLDVAQPDLVVAFPATGSRGTADMMRRAKEAGVRVRCFPVPEVEGR